MRWWQVHGAWLGLAIIAATVARTALGADETAGASGEHTYTHICQGCHMPNGQGAVGAGHYPKLAGDPALVSWEYAALTVLGGRAGMPAFGRNPEPGEFPPAVHLSDAEVADVVNFVRSHFGNSYPDQVSAAQVAALPHPATAASSTEK